MDCRTSACHAQGAVMPEQFAADQAAIAMMQAAGLPLADAKQASDAAVRSQQVHSSPKSDRGQDGPGKRNAHSEHSVSIVIGQ